MNAAEVGAITRRVAAECADMLVMGNQGATVEVPELGETWTITREGN